ncbi:unnamed protein product [Nippostrongylus brasiliensis]|uniref:C2H2-type domain-containing protein n=1 Tax=Nippostrongylus brasiliensis TaxID=27835 RepID=A0A0N4YB85_NIPBR|nr:unnamed protein product [Nippostrongylus brasiliensis]
MPRANLLQYSQQIAEWNDRCFPGWINRKLPASVMEDFNRCRLCDEDVRQTSRHIAEAHLMIQLHQCPLCDYGAPEFSHRENPDAMPRANLLQYSQQIAEWNDRCFPGWINRKLPASVMEDFNRCRLCDEDVRQTSRHIAEAHLMIQLHQCPLCDYGAPESRLVKRHLRNSHDELVIQEMEPIANVVARRADFSALHDKCFPGRPKRLSNITISGSLSPVNIRG